MSCYFISAHTARHRGNQPGLVTTSEWMKSVCSLCDDVRHHLHARGGLVGKAWDYVAEEWVWRTSLAAEYPCGLCVAWSRALLSWLNSASGKRWVERRTMVKLGKWNNTLVRGDLVRQGAPTHSLEAPANTSVKQGSQGKGKPSCNRRAQKSATLPSRSRLS